jgi:putative DNA primase/helicase
MAREKAMFVARKVMNSVAKGFNHPYAIRKRIPNGWYRTYKDKIAVPIFSLPDKKLVNIQFISANGTKRFIKGGMIKGCVGLIGDHTQYHVGVAEGFATAVTIMKQYGARCMFVSLFADNIEPAVAGLVKCGYEVNIFADDDRLNPKNPGYNKALEAGKKHKCVLFVPEWPEDAPKELTDFNDLEGWMLDHSGAQEQNSFRA